MAYPNKRSSLHLDFADISISKNHTQSAGFDLTTHNSAGGDIPLHTYICGPRRHTRAEENNESRQLYVRIFSIVFEQKKTWIIRLQNVQLQLRRFFNVDGNIS
jgi:hypothetical protein